MLKRNCSSYRLSKINQYQNEISKVASSYLSVKSERKNKRNNAIRKESLVQNNHSQLTKHELELVKHSGKFYTPDAIFKSLSKFFSETKIQNDAAGIYESENLRRSGSSEH